MIYLFHDYFTRGENFRATRTIRGPRGCHHPLSCEKKVGEGWTSQSRVFKLNIFYQVDLKIFFRTKRTETQFVLKCSHSLINGLQIRACMVIKVIVYAHKPLQ